MTPERWTRLADLFEAGLERDPQDRATFLATACADDEELRREVELVLESHDHAGSFGDSAAYQLAVIESPRVHSQLAAGSRLGRYEIISLVGKGGMGEVYRARDPQLGRDVGVKILVRTDEISVDQLRRFEHEARTVGSLKHSNILTVYDVGMDTDIPFVVSELLEGETLRARLTAGRLSIKQSIDIALQIASGLAAAHDKGIVHRDLKPENIFITSDGVAKILDFGLAKQTHGIPTGDGANGVSLTGDGLVIGTAAYMSPEQVRGDVADARSDVFAFGAVLYELLTGARAFSGDSAVETMHAILTTSPSGHAPLPPALARVVDGCLEKDPEKRLPSIREAAAALAAASSPGSARRTGWWALAASTAIIAAIVAAAVTFGSRHGPPAVGASGRPALAIVTFDDHSGDPALAWLSSGIPGMLVTSLPQTPGLDVIGSERLAASFSELGRAPTNRGADSEVARRAGAGAVLHGSIFKVGSDIRLDVQVQDVDTGRVVAARTEQGKDVFVLVDAIGGAVRAALDVANRPAGRPVRDVTTASIDAYELYTKAQQARHNNRWNDARTLFQEALRVDPAFTLARAQLVNVLERVGEGAAALVERRTVIDQLDRLPDRQRLMVEALQEYDRNPARAVELLERLLHQYPDEEEAYDAIIHAYTHARDPGYLQKTLAFMQRWERAIPGPGSGHFHNHYGYVYVDHGLFTEAEREFRAYIRVSPDEANAYDSLAELFLMTGRPAQAVDTYDRALRLNPLFGWSHFGRAYALGMQGRYDDAFSALMTLQNLGQRAGVPPAVIHMLEGLAYSRVGRDAEAAEHLDTVRRLARQQDDVGTEADIDLIDAALAVERGQRARAIEYADRARTSATRTQLDIMRARRTAVAYLLAGMAESRAGRLAAAHRLLELQQKLDVGGDPTQVSWQRALAGEIALAEHRFDDAEAAFRAAEFQPGSSFAIYPAAVALANNLPFRDGLARTARARGDTVRAIDLYRRLNQPDSGSKWMSLYDPRYAQAATELTAYAPAVSPISKSPR